MLYATAGAQIHIADAPADQAGAFPAMGWVEIGETEALGVLGIAAEGVEVLDMTADAVGTLKGVMRRKPMQIIMGDDPADPGQALLWSAVRSQQCYPFRLTLAGGYVRQWFALIMGISEVFDSANSVMRMQVDLMPVGDIQRSEAP